MGWEVKAFDDAGGERGVQNLGKPDDVILERSLKLCVNVVAKLGAKLNALEKVAGERTPTTKPASKERV